MSEGYDSSSVNLQLVALVVAASGLVSFAASMPLDHDSDGLSTLQEWRAGTKSLDADTDKDGLVDGWEQGTGLSPLREDTDGDGLGDGWEVVRQLQATNPDMDDDGVLDGDERAMVCLLRRDCDDDGLEDGLEREGFSSLDPDSFDAGLPDGVVSIFAAAGQPPSSDADNDGIPDAWEGSAGLISWGPFEPRPGEQDLLVEFLRVQGPESGRFTLDFSPAYRAVATMMAGDGIRMSWVETVVTLSGEHRPGFLDLDELPYYQDILAAGVASTNPFVTSIVLNPQQEQEDLAGDVLGAAFLRSMIATVDYGAHATVSFRQVDSDGLSYDGTLQMRPVVESHIVGARLDQVRQLQRQGDIVRMGVENGAAYYVIPDDNLGPITWRWNLNWFSNGPVVSTEDGSYIRFASTGASLDTAGLAGTIAHELGHTLGLCHAHEPECYQEFSFNDAMNRHASTMSYAAPQGTLNFLPSEWDQVHDYLTCPPSQPIALLASGGSPGDILAAKYDLSFKVATQLRACGDFSDVPEDMARTGVLHIESAKSLNTANWVTLHAILSVGAAGAVLRWRW